MLRLRRKARGVADFGKSANHQLKMRAWERTIWRLRWNTKRRRRRRRGERGLQEEEEWGERRKRGKRRKWRSGEIWEVGKAAAAERGIHTG